jgi:hypothetical protein
MFLGYLPIYVIALYLSQDVIGVSVEDIQIDSAVQVALISTVKASLVPEAGLRASFNVTIDSVSDDNRRLSALRGKNKQLVVSTAQVQYAVSFDVDKQQYLDAADGYSQMTSSYSVAISDGQFSSTLHTYAQSGSPLVSATGATTSVYSAYSVKYIQLMYPSFAPTVSCRPTVTPTQQPSTRTPTRVPTTTSPTVTPTTIAPTALPTFKTSKIDNCILFCYLSLIFKSQ